MSEDDYLGGNPEGDDILPPPPEKEDTNGLRPGFLGGKELRDNRRLRFIEKSREHRVKRDLTMLRMQVVFLRMLSMGYSQAEACRVLDIHYYTPNRWARNSERFKARFAEAKADRLGILEDVSFRTAREGDQRALERELKANDPHKYSAAGQARRVFAGPGDNVDELAGQLRQAIFGIRDLVPPAASGQKANGEAIDVEPEGDGNDG